jgi:hypothetical protein
VALATALAESALESEREEHTAGPGENTPARLYDFNDPQLYGLNGQACLGDGNWGDYDQDNGSWAAAACPSLALL